MNALNSHYRIARRVVIAVIGGTVFLLGLVMLVMPGPGMLVATAGLGILALEFYWARRWLARLRLQMQQLSTHVHRWNRH